jgi:hypothetical protein
VRVRVLARTSMVVLVHSGVTPTYEYHYKGHELYEQLLHVAYTQFDTLPLPLYILLLLLENEILSPMVPFS